MGWSGYGVYDGDGTQSLHVNFLKIALPSLIEDEILEMLSTRKTKIPDSYLLDFRRALPLIVKKIKAPKAFSVWDEDKALEWQMLLSLIMDNNLIVPYRVLVYGILATHWLLGNHADDFNEPAKRRTSLKRFLKKADGCCSVQAKTEINRRLIKK